MKCEQLLKKYDGKRIYMSPKMDVVNFRSDIPLVAYSGAGFGYNDHEEKDYLA